MYIVLMYNIYIYHYVPVCVFQSNVLHMYSDKAQVVHDLTESQLQLLTNRGLYLYFQFGSLLTRRELGQSGYTGM